MVAGRKIGFVVVVIGAGLVGLPRAHGLTQLEHIPGKPPEMLQEVVAAPPRAQAVLHLLGALAPGAMVEPYLPSYESETNYFSDPGFSEWVGSETILCDGTRRSEGEIGEYRHVLRVRCSGGQTQDHCYRFTCNSFE